MAYAEVFTALADPTRRRILEALRERPRTVGELAEGQPVSRPAVSQHRKVLQAARVGTVQPQRHRRLYLIKRDRPEDLRQKLEDKSSGQNLSNNFRRSSSPPRVIG